MIFPVTESQSNGIEDARFVQFSDAGRQIYYATYTAYSGRAIRSELMETSDFLSFRLWTLKGSAAQNKGMALFPKKIGGEYAMIARQDNENLYLIYSNDLYTWNGGQAILKPQFPWEFVQIASARSTEPIETISIANPREPAAGTMIMVPMRRNAANESPSIDSSSVMTS